MQRSDRTQATLGKHICRLCGTGLSLTFVDLGMSPIANDLIDPLHQNQGEVFYPLKALVCEECWLVQLSYVHAREKIFSDEYPYYSSVSTSWLKHAEEYVDLMIRNYELSSKSKIIEVASNDGYLLKNFKKIKADVLGVEPCKNIANFAYEKNQINTIVEFLTEKSGENIASTYGKADLIIANNVLAHVPDIKDFIMGLKNMLSLEGVLTLEFPHLLSLIENNQFDTVYHEHYSYLSIHAVKYAFNMHGLRIFNIESLKSHGGSLRVFVCHEESNRHEQESVQELINLEKIKGLTKPETYIRFQDRTKNIKRELISFLIEVENQGKSCMAYGAPAKGNTLLNYCGVRNDTISFTVDLSTAKQGLLLPGSRLQIKKPEEIYKFKPDFLLILPWNLKDEIIRQHNSIKDWGGKFVVPIPNLSII